MWCYRNLFFILNVCQTSHGLENMSSFFSTIITHQVLLFVALWMCLYIQMMDITFYVPCENENSNRQHNIFNVLSFTWMYTRFLSIDLNHWAVINPLTITIRLNLTKSFWNKTIHRPHIFYTVWYTFENKLWAWLRGRTKKKQQQNKNVMEIYTTSNILFPYDLINLKFLNYYTFSSFRMFNIIMLCLFLWHFFLYPFSMSLCVYILN